MQYICDNARHLICVPYSVANLHAMARDLELHRGWFHSKNGKSHYDMPVKRIREITAKCKIVTSKEIIRIMAKKMQLHLDGEGVVKEFTQALSVYGMDFELLEKSNRNVAYIKVTTRLNRPAPNSVIGHLHVTGWKALQTHRYVHKVYRYRKANLILVIKFPDIQEYDLRGDTPERDRLNSDKERKTSYFGITQKSGEKAKSS
jgi:hypothetical protein